MSDHNERHHNIIEQAFHTFEDVQKANMAPIPDEVSFVGGFMTLFGILTGRVDIGLDQNMPLDKIMDMIHEELSNIRDRVVENTRKQMQ